MKGLRDLDGRAVEKQGLLGYAGGLPAAAVWNQQKLEIGERLVQDAFDRVAQESPLSPVDRRKYRHLWHSARSDR